jgi:hypothetical protein
MCPVQQPAVVGYEGGLDFCLDCNLKYQQAQELILFSWNANVIASLMISTWSPACAPLPGVTLSGNLQSR